MNRNKITLLFIFMCLTALKAQYLPMLGTDKHWVFETIEDSDSNSGAIRGFLVNIQGDTVINGNTYQKLYAHNLLGQHDCSYPPCFSPNIPYEIQRPFLYGFLREDTQQEIVYCYGFDHPNYLDCEEELELFNFSLMKGDSLDTCVRSWLGAGWLESDDEAIGLVDTITTEFIQNEQRRVIYTQGDVAFNGLQFAGEVLITEGVGFDYYGFFPGTQDRLIDFCVGNLSECNIITSIKNHIEIPKMEIYPNPVYEQLIIESNDKISRVLIRDDLGQLMYEGKEAQIDLRLLGPGIYFVEVLFKNNRRATSKFVKMN